MSNEEADIPSRFAVDFSGQTLLGIYEVGEKLADGGMGSVYRAVDTNLKRPVVVKVPHARFLGEAGFRGRFKREVNELVRLEHPNIVRILAQGEHDELPYHVLQYLGGGNLEQQIEAGGRGQDPATVLEWLRPIARTLDFIHARDVVHRDVKPDNILFDEAGHVFLSDFGVVKALQGDDLEATAMGTGIGSPQYMSPEQGIGRSVDGRADQYALATTVYEALTGRPPYDAKTTVELLIKKDREAPINLAELVPDLPPAAVDAVMKAMSRDPDDRYDTCKDFADAFAEAMSLPINTPALGTQVDVQPGGLPPRKSLLLLGLLVLLIGGLAYAAGFFEGESTTKTPPPVEPSPAVANTGPEIDLTVIDVGAEPRRTLRYVPVAGSTEKVEMVLTNKQRMTVDGKEAPSRVAPSTRLHLDLDVAKVGDTGDIGIKWTAGKGEIVDEESVDPEMVEQMQKMFEEAKGVSGTTRITDRGIAYNPDDWEKEEKLSPFARAYFANLRMGMRQLTTPFPKEPVGVGAIWDVKANTNMFSVRMMQTTTFEILEMDENRVKLRVSIAIAAPQQSLKMGGVESRITRMFSTGSADLEVDLGYLAPNRYDSKVSVEIQVETPMEEGVVRREIEIESTNEVGRR